MHRHFRGTQIERALPPRVVAALISLAILAIAVAIAVPIVIPILAKEPQARRLQWERFSNLSVGDTKTQAASALGPPPLVCRGTNGIYRHQIKARRATWDALVHATAERWIYPLPFEEARSGAKNTATTDVPAEQPCRPDYAEGEVGFDSGGKVLWFIALTNESYVVY